MLSWLGVGLESRGSARSADGSIGNGLRRTGRGRESGQLMMWLGGGLGGLKGWREGCDPLRSLTGSMSRDDERDMVDFLTCMALRIEQGHQNATIAFVRPHIALSPSLTSNNIRPSPQRPRRSAQQRHLPWCGSCVLAIPIGETDFMSNTSMLPTNPTSTLLPSTTPPAPSTPSPGATPHSSPPLSSPHTSCPHTQTPNPTLQRPRPKSASPHPQCPTIIRGASKTYQTSPGPSPPQSSPTRPIHQPISSPDNLSEQGDSRPSSPERSTRPPLPGPLRRNTQTCRSPGRICRRSPRGGGGGFADRIGRGSIFFAMSVRGMWLGGEGWVGDGVTCRARGGYPMR